MRITKHSVKVGKPFGCQGLTTIDDLGGFRICRPRLRFLLSLRILTMTDEEGWQGETRRLDADVLGDLVGGFEDKTFFVAGPPGMVEGVSESLLAAGLPEDRVVAGKFSGY